MVTTRLPEDTAFGALSASHRAQYRRERGCRTNSSESDTNPCSSTRSPCVARNKARLTEMTSEIDDPSVETDLCDNLERVTYRAWLIGTSGRVETLRLDWAGS